jgi:AraC-like DNA-binding protein
MDFTIHQPPPAISDSVKAIWCARGTREEFAAPEPIVPDGCVEIVFNLGHRFIHAKTGEVQPRDLLAGQMTGPVVALPTGDVDLIGVRFHTGRAGTALGMAMWELQDRLIAAASVVRHADRLADDLRNVDREARLDHLVQALTDRLAAPSSTCVVDHALAIIEASRGRIAIEAIARRLGISRRHLERQFRDHVGLSAKHIARISRIHAALAMLHERPQLSGAEIAAECGYSDQAHLIRECQELAGQTPQRLKSTDRSLAGLMRST